MDVKHRLARYKYQPEIQSMMFTFGDARNPLPAATQLVEDIVHAQMVDMLQRATEIAGRRGSRSLIVDDFIFIVRHDAFKVKRLKEFLSWKDIRKNVRSNAGENGEEFIIGEEEEPKETQTESPTGGKTAVKRKVCLYWDYLDTLLEGNELLSEGEEEHEGSDLDEYYNEAQERLREADLITKEMTKEEYIEYSECRQASFTFKKAKKFRDWIAFSKYVDIKPNDDIIEILGFLAWEIVRILTDTALKVKYRYEKFQIQPTTPEKSVAFGDVFTVADWTTNGEGTTLLSKHIQGSRSDKQQPSKKSQETSPGSRKESVTSSGENIFEKPEKRTAIKPEHIYEACRLLEKSNYIFDLFSGGLMRKSFSPIA